MQQQHRIKPKVGIIYSQSDEYSCESMNLAYYLCGLLSNSGYSEIKMIGYNQDNMNIRSDNGCHSSDKIANRSSSTSHKRIKYILPGNVTPNEVSSSSLVSYTYFNTLNECHLIIITVNSNDTKACCNRMIEAFSQSNNNNIIIFSLQRGIKNGDIVKDTLSNNKFIVIEAVVGFAVVLDPKYSAYISTIANPSILYERLTKENEKIVDGPLRLLEAMKTQVYFRKTLTRKSYMMMMMVMELFVMINDDYEGGDGDNDDVDHDIAPVKRVVTMIAMHMIDDCRLHHFVL